MFKLIKSVNKYFSVFLYCCTYVVVLAVFEGIFVIKHFSHPS